MTLTFACPNGHENRVPADTSTELSCGSPGCTLKILIPGHLILQNSLNEARRTLQISTALPRVVCVALLLWAMMSHTYAYYTMLRWVVFMGCIYTGSAAIAANVALHGWVLGCLIVLYNPIWPITLDKPTWFVLNSAAAVVLLITFVSFKPRSVQALDKLMKHGAT